ncbi:MAG: ABC transporter ATP-binding protein [Ktedonobacterales bacterium]
MTPQELDALSGPGSEPVAAAQDVSRDFRPGSGIVHALRGVSLAIRPGEFVALRGRSGSGKTTLLNILTGLDNPTLGTVTILGRKLAGMDETARARLRRESVGMMFQNAHLFALLTAEENVELPLRLAGADPARRKQLARQMLEYVGLGQRAHHRGMELSGGEQQRVALARALVHGPRFVVADEPTGNLDSMTGRAVIELVSRMTRQFNLGFLVATHDMNVVAAADHVLNISDGTLSAAD